MSRAKLAWPVRSVIAGTGGTATMTLAYAAERRLRPRARGPLDYDDSLVPGQIVASVMHLPHVTGREERDLGLLLRWTLRLGVRAAARRCSAVRSASRGPRRCSARRS